MKISESCYVSNEVHGKRRSGRIWITEYIGIGRNCSASISLNGDHIEADGGLSFVVQPVGLVQVTKPFLEAGKPISAGILARQVLAPGGESHLHRPNVCSVRT